MINSPSREEWEKQITDALITCQNKEELIEFILKKIDQASRLESAQGYEQGLKDALAKCVYPYDQREIEYLLKNLTKALEE